MRIIENIRIVMMHKNHKVTQECPSVEGQPPACLKNSTENAHQISLSLIKVDLWGVVDMHYFDLDLGPMTFISGPVV